MIAIFISPVYIFLNIYILWHFTKWLGECHYFLKHKAVKLAIICIYSFAALSLVIGFLLPPTGIGRTMRIIGNYWLGFLLYIILSVAISHLIGFIVNHIPRFKHLNTRRNFVIMGAVCTLIVLATGTYGIINAHIIHTTDYDIKIDKNAGDLKELNAVLIADLHMGYNIGEKSIAAMAEKINAVNPDIVFIAGDIFDNEYEALDNPERLAEIFRSIKTKYGIYACYGNHDISEKILAGFTFASKNKEKMSDERMDEWLKSADIKLLRDEYVLIDNSFYVYGRPDYKKPGRGISKRKTPQEITADMDKTKPIIVIDHEPNELAELSAAGVDADLCGHTHDGQMFPGNLTINLFWENACGYLKKGAMHNIVTSGVGLFGPNMRVATKAEICPIHITFK